MNSETASLPMLVGRALKSTVLIMGELGSMGTDVLKAHDVHDIDIDGWYPAKLRQEIHEAAYKRFGPAALLNFGFSMGDHYSQALITASLEKYQSLMESVETKIQGLDWFVKNFTHAYHEATKASQHCDSIDYGFYSKQLGPLLYEFNAVSTLLPHHQSFSEGIIRGYLVRFISHHWDFELSFQSERTHHDKFHSTFYWTCEFRPKSELTISAEESTATYRLHIKEILFKKVLDESNSALATLMSSVRYARLIQEAQLPHPTNIQTKLKDFAVEWHPRDTIGGDFWWSQYHQPSNSLVIALIDCTGHGVPGAMLSVLVNSQLDKVFSSDPCIDLSEAVRQLDQLIRKSLRQELTHTESDDGCDGAFIRIHLSTRQLEYVGVKINLYELTSTNEVVQHKADRISLGYRDVPASYPLTRTWHAAPGSRFIVTTDGVTDQLGGHEKTPVAFGYRRLLDALRSNTNASTAVIASQLLQAVTDWQGERARRDDLTIIAIEI